MVYFKFGDVARKKIENKFFHYVAIYLGGECVVPCLRWEFKQSRKTKN